MIPPDWVIFFHKIHQRIGKAELSELFQRHSPLKITVTVVRLLIFLDFAWEMVGKNNGDLPC